MRKRLHIYYSGMVQGVGFRFTAERVAASLGITGWVRNLPDGRVEVLCEGEEAVLVGFIGKMNAGPMREYIRNSRVDWSAATGEFGGFSVKYY